MSTWKDGMLILTGGAIGLMLAAVLDASEEDDESEEKIDAMQLLVSKIRFEGEEALKSCSTDEEREKVFLQIESSIHEMQENLQSKTEKILADLKLQSESTRKNSTAEHLQNITRTFQELSDSLDVALKNLKVDVEG